MKSISQSSVEIRLLRLPLLKMNWKCRETKIIHVYNSVKYLWMIKTNSNPEQSNAFIDNKMGWRDKKSHLLVSPLVPTSTFDIPPFGHIRHLVRLKVERPVRCINYYLNGVPFLHSFAILYQFRRINIKLVICVCKYAIPGNSNFIWKIYNCYSHGSQTKGCNICTNPDPQYLFWGTIQYFIKLRLEI